MKHVTKNPPTFKAILWDGDTKSEFESLDDDLTVVGDDKDLVVIQGQSNIQVPRDHYLVLEDGDANVTNGVVVNQDDFDSLYTEVESS